MRCCSLTRPVARDCPLFRGLCGWSSFDVVPVFFERCHVPPWLFYVFYVLVVSSSWLCVLLFVAVFLRWFHAFLAFDEEYFERNGAERETLERNGTERWNGGTLVYSPPGGGVVY